MSKHVSASDAKNNFGGLLEDVATLGRVDIVKHGRLVAVMLSPRAFNVIPNEEGKKAGSSVKWGENHMIPPDRAHAARMIEPPRDFDED
jgi:prevent-host-death family protein